MAKLPSDPIQRAIVTSREYRAAMEELAERMEKAAIEAAPVDQGELRDSIHAEVTPEGTIIVRADAPHAVPVDQGTARTKAVPYLSGAALDVRAD